MAELDDKDVWGDDQLIASDVSIPYLLQYADWTGLFNQKGFDGQYPMILFMHEEAERISDALMSEINRTQILSGDCQLRVDVATKFLDHGPDVTGRGLLVVSGLDEFCSDYLADFLYLIRSGVQAWLTGCYSTHGVTSIVEWLPDAPDIGEWAKWLHERCPQPLTSNHRIYVATIDKG